MGGDCRVPWEKMIVNAMNMKLFDRGALLLGVIAVSIYLVGCGPSNDFTQAPDGMRLGDMVVHAAEPVPVEDPVTVELTRTDAESGGADAQFQLGQWYYEGRHVDQDYVLACQWYRQALGNGHPQAALSLASLTSRMSRDQLAQIQ